MFKRHGWKKKVPRPSHPKANREEQEEYKKLQENLATKSLEFKDKKDKRPIKLFFETFLLCPLPSK